MSNVARGMVRAGDRGCRNKPGIEASTKVRAAHPARRAGGAAPCPPRWSQPATARRPLSAECSADQWARTLHPEAVGGSAGLRRPQRLAVPVAGTDAVHFTPQDPRCSPTQTPGPRPESGTLFQRDAGYGSPGSRLQAAARHSPGAQEVTDLPGMLIQHVLGVWRAGWAKGTIQTTDGARGARHGQVATRGCRTSG